MSWMPQHPSKARRKVAFWYDTPSPNALVRSLQHQLRIRIPAVPLAGMPLRRLSSSAFQGLWHLLFLVPGACSRSCNCSCRFDFGLQERSGVLDVCASACVEDVSCCLFAVLQISPQQYAHTHTHTLLGNTEGSCSCV